MDVPISASEEACCPQLLLQQDCKTPALVMDRVGKGKTLRAVRDGNCGPGTCPLGWGGCGVWGCGIWDVGCGVVPLLQRLHRAVGTCLFQDGIAVQKSSSKLHAR